MQSDIDTSDGHSLAREPNVRAKPIPDEVIPPDYYHSAFEVKTAFELLLEDSENSQLTWQADTAWPVRCSPSPEAVLQQLSRLHRLIATEGYGDSEARRGRWVDVTAALLAEATPNLSRLRRALDGGRA
jgi:hypothetical protein